MPEFHYRWEWRLRSSPSGSGVDLSSGTDVVVSSTVTADPEVADLLGSALIAAPIEATLKGFEDERFEIWSVD